MKNSLLPIAGIAIAVGGFVLFLRYANWWGINIAVQPETIANIMAPLVLTSAFIERAVEVVITPWRDPGADKLTAELKAASSNPAATQAQTEAVAEKLRVYVADTTRFAFIIALLLGLLAAMVGIRALWPFLDAHSADVFRGVSCAHRNTFIGFDVVLSAALMAGGASGIHSVVSSVTSFFDANTEKARASVNS